MRFFDILAPNRALRWIENPRVDGSIPSLAITSKSMICIRFIVSPADYLRPDGTDPRTIGNWADRSPEPSGGAGDLGTWEAGELRGRSTWLR